MTEAKAKESATIIPISQNFTLDPQETQNMLNLAEKVRGIPAYLKRNAVEEIRGDYITPSPYNSDQCQGDQCQGMCALMAMYGIARNITPNEVLRNISDFNSEEKNLINIGWEFIRFNDDLGIDSVFFVDRRLRQDGSRHYLASYSVGETIMSLWDDGHSARNIAKIIEALCNASHIEVLAEDDLKFAFPDTEVLESTLPFEGDESWTADIYKGLELDNLVPTNQSQND